VNTIPVGLDAASLPHTLPGKAPRPGLLVSVTSRSCSNLHLLAHLRLGSKCLRTGRGEFFQDRRQQGCWRGAYKDVFTACPERTHRSLNPAQMLRGSIYGVSRVSLPAADCAPKPTNGKALGSLQLRRALKELTPPRTWQRST